jgi:hypothetical protein
MNESEDLKKPDKELAGFYIFLMIFYDFFSNDESECVCVFSQPTNAFRLV